MTFQPAVAGDHFFHMGRRLAYRGVVGNEGIYYREGYRGITVPYSLLTTSKSGGWRGKDLCLMKSFGFRASG